jgi:peptidoglycan-associated lipoprotein
MKNISKITLTGLAALVILVSPACKSNRKKVAPVVTPQPVAEQTAPDIAAPPVRSDTDVAPREDFVSPTVEPTSEEIRPTDIEALNRWAQERGYIRDAYFNLAEAALDGAAQDALQTSATWLKGDGAGYNVLIEGHCDERGTEQYNLALGDRRANAAKDYLATLGVNAGRIRTVSYGEERPFDEGHDEAAWAQNRRAHIVLVQAR